MNDEKVEMILCATVNRKEKIKFFIGDFVFE